jgi:hypothetical protein
MNTSPLQRILSKEFPNKTAAMAVEVIFLLLVGMVAITLHSKLRIPMHLPGKQGILFVALVVSSRGLSRLSFAASITCIGSALLLWTGFLGFHDPFIAVTYVLLGGVMDLLFLVAAKYSEKPWILALASGIAWTFIPLIRLVLSLFVTMPMNSFSSGIAYPFITHLLFGFTGGLIGAGILTLFKTAE